MEYYEPDLVHARTCRLLNPHRPYDPVRFPHLSKLHQTVNVIISKMSSTALGKNTCTWSHNAPDYRAYHDVEWGTPVTTNLKMFEFLLLETFQSGLSWITILRRRSAFSNAFHAFDPTLVAKMTPADIDRLMTDTSIIRNRAKITAAVENAQMVLKMLEKERIGLAEYFWRWVGFLPIDNKAKSTSDLPSSTDLSVRISKDLKRRGFRFVGPTVVYAHLQATGIVNDHVVTCSRYREVKKLAWGLSEWREAGVDCGVLGEPSPVLYPETELQQRKEIPLRRKRKRVVPRNDFADQAESVRRSKRLAARESS